MLLSSLPALAQVPPSADDIVHYKGLFRSVFMNDAATIDNLIARSKASGAGPLKPDAYRDFHERTPLHVAAHVKARAAMRALARAGADANALEKERYDIVTIAAVNNDVETLQVALEIGCKESNITSPYAGTALIAAAHLGHVEVVRVLIGAGAPLDHVNNLKWTALHEAIVLGDGGARHTATLQALLDAGANPNLPDGKGQTALTLAKARGFTAMVQALEAKAAR
jgi:ankyrin repeat protein